VTETYIEYCAPDACRAREKCRSDLEGYFISLYYLYKILNEVRTKYVNRQYLNAVMVLMFFDLRELRTGVIEQDDEKHHGACSEICDAAAAVKTLYSELNNLFHELTVLSMKRVVDLVGLQGILTEYKETIDTIKEYFEIHLFKRHTGTFEMYYEPFYRERKEVLKGYVSELNYGE